MIGWSRILLEMLFGRRPVTQRSAQLVLIWLSHASQRPLVIVVLVGEVYVRSPP
jgi:hypothetical protein